MHKKKNTFVTIELVCTKYELLTCEITSGRACFHRHMRLDKNKSEINTDTDQAQLFPLVVLLYWIFFFWAQIDLPINAELSVFW